MIRNKYPVMVNSLITMACLDSLLGYSTGEFQPFQLGVFAMYGAVD